MPILRTLNEKGIKAFRDFLGSIRAGAEFESSPAILYVAEYSSALPKSITIENKRFAGKRDAAKYLTTVLQPIDSPALQDDIGLWSWLALFYFDQLSPAGANGKRMPREDYHYIPGGDGWTRDRHLLAGPYRLYRMHGEQARLLLYPQVHEHGNFIYQLSSRRDLVTNRGLIEAMDLLYWNPRFHRPKPGATTETRPGNLRRLITVLQQLDFNYDLHGMTAREILDLLPAEFESWKPDGRQLALASATP